MFINWDAAVYNNNCNYIVSDWCTVWRFPLMKVVLLLFAQGGGYLCSGSGLQQLCQAAQFTHECCSGFAGHHTGTISSTWFYSSPSLFFASFIFFLCVALFLVPLCWPCAVPCHGHAAPAWLWPFKCTECSGATGRPCALQGRNGGVELFRGQSVWRSVGEIRQRFQRHPARLCESKS